MCRASRLFPFPREPLCEIRFGVPRTRVCRPLSRHGKGEGGPPRRRSAAWRGKGFFATLLTEAKKKSDAQKYASPV